MTPAVLRHMPRRMDFRNRWVLVTGASAGLGREFARLLALEHGANLIVVARRKERLQRLRAELERDAGVQVRAIEGDLSDPLDCERVLAQILAGPSVYAAILNAAVTHFGPYDQLDATRFRLLLNTNVSSTVSLATGLIPHIERDQPGGGLMFVASLAGLQPVPYQSAYSASKAFIVHFACGLSHELTGRDVSVTTFAPGGIVTEMTAGENFAPLSRWLMPAARCARLGLEAFRRREYLYVPGCGNRVATAIASFLPRRFATALVARTYRRALDAEPGRKIRPVAATPNDTVPGDHSPLHSTREPPP